MKWEVTFLKETGIVWVEASGSMDRALIEGMSSDAISEAVKQNAPRILVDHRKMTPEFPTVEIHSLPAKLAELGLSSAIKVAILYSKDSAHRRDFEFFATVAINRGFEVQLFEHPIDAINWLSSPAG